MSDETPIRRLVRQADAQRAALGNEAEQAGAIAALSWALDLLDLYDDDLIKRGDPPGEVNTQLHLAGKGKARQALFDALAALSAPVPTPAEIDELEYHAKVGSLVCQMPEGYALKRGVDGRSGEYWYASATGFSWCYGIGPIEALRAALPPARRAGSGR